MTEELPEGWVWATLEDLLSEKIINGRSVPTREGGFPVLRLNAIKQGKIDPSVSKEGAWGEAEATPYLLRAGDFLLSRGNGTLSLVGRGGLVAEDAQVAFPDTMMRVRVNPGVLDLKYFCLLWNSSVVRDQIEASARTTAGIYKVNQEILRAIKIPLAPLAEQRMIVAALEAEISRLDKSEALLGKLSPRGGRLAVRFADSLIEPLYSGATKPLGDLLREPLRNGHSARADKDGDVRTLTLTAVTKGVFSDEYTKLTSANRAKVSDLWVRSGDILIQRSNTPDLVGTSAIYKGQDGWAIFPDLLIRVRPSVFMDPGFVLRILQSSRVRSYFKKSAKGLAGSMPKIDQNAIERVQVPVLSLEEQRSLVVEMNDYSDRISRVRSSLGDISVKAQRLRRALLAAAFTGKLVPQDSSDEPASVLLERIRAEQAAVPKPKRGRKAKASTALRNPVPIPEDSRPVPPGEQTALEF